MSRFSSLIPLTLVGGCGILTAVATFQPEFEKLARGREEEQQQKQSPITDNHENAVTIQQPSKQPSSSIQRKPTEAKDEKPNPSSATPMTSRFLGWFSFTKAANSDHDSQATRDGGKD